MSHTEEGEREIIYKLGINLVDFTGEEINVNYTYGFPISYANPTLIQKHVYIIHKFTAIFSSWHCTTAAGSIMSNVPPNLCAEGNLV
jgi:hypothetical protein